MSEPFPSDRITGPDYISVADARKAIMKAREEGRRDGLEEVEKALRTLRFDSNDPWGGVESFVWRAIRALKEKQP